MFRLMKRQRQQGDRLCSVSLEPAVAHFGVTELALDDSEWMLHFGLHAGVEFLDCSLITTQVCIFASCAYLAAWLHANTPVASGRLVTPW